MSDEAVINSFDLYFPLPYRVVLLVNCGLLLWHLNLLTCNKFKIDVMMVLKISPQELTLSKLISKSWDCLVNVTIINFAGYIIYHFFISNGFESTLIDWLPLFSIIFTFAMLLKTGSTFESKRLSKTMRRVIKGEIDISIRNNDILLTDTFTSYNKVLVDFLVYLTALFLGMQALPSGQNLSKELSKTHLQLYNIDLLLANFPSFLRFKQCLQEFNQSGRKNRQHLYNAIKYSTSFFPTISLICFKAGIFQTQSIWFFTTFINSSYSFFWDITNDWNFGFFSKFLNDKPNSNVLRSRLIYNKSAYILAIVIDFQLRFLWVYKLFFVNNNSSGVFSSFFVMLFTTELGNFLLEILEIFRRWVWVFLKIETEYVKMISTDSMVELHSFD